MDLRRRTRWLALLGLLAGAWLVSRLSDGARALALVRAAGPAALMLVLPYAAATALAALPWRLLSPPSARPSRLEALRSRFTSASVNVLVPGGMAGEPLRLRGLAPAMWGPAGEALVWDRVVYLAATALFLLAATVVASMRAQPLVASALGGAAFGALVFGGALATASRHDGLRRWTARLATKVAGPFSSTTERSNRSPGAGAFGWATALHFSARMLLAAEVWVAAWLVGASLDGGEWLLVSGAMTATAVALPFVPGQAGVQEAALAGALLATGHPPSFGLAVSLLIRLRQLLFVPIGLVLLQGTRPAPLDLTASNDAIDRTGSAAGDE